MTSLGGKMRTNLNHIRTFMPEKQLLQNNSIRKSL